MLQIEFGQAVGQAVCIVRLVVLSMVINGSDLFRYAHVCVSCAGVTFSRP